MQTAQKIPARRQNVKALQQPSPCYAGFSLWARLWSTPWPIRLHHLSPQSPAMGHPQPRHPHPKKILCRVPWYRPPLPWAQSQGQTPAPQPRHLHLLLPRDLESHAGSQACMEFPACWEPQLPRTCPLRSSKILYWRAGLCWTQWSQMSASSSVAPVLQGKREFCTDCALQMMQDCPRSGGSFRSDWQGIHAFKRWRNNTPNLEMGEALLPTAHLFPPPRTAIPTTAIQRAREWQGSLGLSWMMARFLCTNQSSDRDAVWQGLAFPSG